MNLELYLDPQSLLQLVLRDQPLFDQKFAEEGLAWFCLFVDESSSLVIYSVLYLGSHTLRQYSLDCLAEGMLIEIKDVSFSVQCEEASSDTGLETRDFVERVRKALFFMDNVPG